MGNIVQSLISGLWKRCFSKRCSKVLGIYKRLRISRSSTKKSRTWSQEFICTRFASLVEYLPLVSSSFYDWSAQDSRFHVRASAAQGGATMTLFIIGEWRRSIEPSIKTYRCNVRSRFITLGKHVDLRTDFRGVRFLLNKLCAA